MQEEVNLGSHTYGTNTQNESNPLEPKVHTRAQQVNETQEIPAQFIDTEFQVPTDFVELPSNGLFYNNRKSSVEIKYLTAEDENILTSQDLIKSGKVLDVLLQNSIIDKDINPEDMLTGDRNAVLIALRITGYGDEYETKTICPSCSTTNEETILLSSLGIKDIADRPDSEGLFSVQLPKCKANIKFRLLKGSDEARLQKISELGKKNIGKNVKVQTVLTERYLLQIMDVNGNRDKTYIKKFISVMPIADSFFFREYLGEVEPGMDMNHGFDCKSCGHSYEQEVPITAKLFWPNANV
jgi:rubredoxin